MNAVLSPVSSSQCDANGLYVASNNADYQVGAILEAQWGYDQTNINYFVIIKRTKAMVTLQEVAQKDRVETGFMSGTCLPDVDKPHGKPIRRKLAMRDGKIVGCSFESSYGWMKLWDGQPSHWTNYA